MLDLIFFTPGTTKPDFDKVMKLKDKVLESIGGEHILADDMVMLYDENNRQFRILIGKHNQYDIHLEIEVENVYERDKYSFF